MDTVWTTVKVRRSALADAAEKMPGMANSAIVQAGLERLIGTPSTPMAPHRPTVTQRAPVAQKDARTDLGRAVTRMLQPPEQTTVEEMLASCPNCAGEMQDYCLDDDKDTMAKRCEDCGFVREPDA